VPIRGAGIKKTKAFFDVERVITSHGFRHGAPNRMPSPGFRFYSRNGYVVQVLNGRRVSITAPDGSVQVISARKLVNVDTALDCVILEIEEQEAGQ
jgi:hypothetical protein